MPPHDDRDSDSSVHIEEPARNPKGHMRDIRRSISSVAAIAVLLVACASTAAQQPGQEMQRTLAPSGKLRVGVYPGSPTSMIQDASSGQRKGVTYDLGTELARRLGVPFEPVVFQRVAEVVDALKSGQIDFTITNASPARVKDLDFTPTLLDLELGYVVLPGSPVAALADVDRPGIRVGVSEGSTSFGTLSREFKNATVVAAPSLKSAMEMLSQKKIDAFATNKAILFEMTDELPGSRVLDGRWGLEHLAMAIPKGRDAAMAYLRKFAEDARSEGLVKRAVERAGLRGTVSQN
jgi:polar amino acid transport system substrate-binding protein